MDVTEEAGLKLGTLRPDTVSLAYCAKYLTSTKNFVHMEPHTSTYLIFECDSWISMHASHRRGAISDNLGYLDIDILQYIFSHPATQMTAPAHVHRISVLEQ